MKKLNIFYWILTLVLILDTIAYLKWNYSFTGIWIDKLIFWGWILFTIVLFYNNYLRKWLIWYLGFLSFFVFLTLLPMGLPFLSIIFYATDFNQPKEVIDSEIKIIRYHYDGLGLPTYRLVENRYFLFEKEIGFIESEFWLESIDKIYSFEDIISVERLQGTGGNQLKLNFEKGSMTMDVIPLYN